MSAIYLDYAATTPLDPRVLKTMLPVFQDLFGNPSSVHRYGQQAETVLEQARRSLAGNLGADPEEIIFTSCGTESDNLALRGSAFAARENRGADHILIPPLEHHAVLHTAQQLAKFFGFNLEFLPVDRYGRTTADDVKQKIQPQTAVVSVMYANNEIGTLNPVAEIAEVCQQVGIPFHTDAVQAAAHLPINTAELLVDMLSLGAHKFYGPKGVGALYIRSGTPLIPVQTGGSQEFGLRAATENLPLIIGMTEAFNYQQVEYPNREGHSIRLREKLIEQILQSIPEVTLTGHREERLPNHASFAFRDTDSNLLVSLLDARGIACSSGSACKTGNPEPSRILEELGFSSRWTSGSLRITIGKDTTDEEIDQLISLLPETVAEARELS
ncbi:MAG: cysteine desulfurase family protein [Anaerolineales bacterium]|nr:cysteine desulfurase family protein [Anaerolineales bacterium]